MPVVIPNIFVGGPGNKAKASEVNANFAALGAKFNGGILDADVSDTAGIKGSKLSSTPGNRITQAQLDTAAVDGRVLKSDSVGTHDNAAVNLADHIKDAIITNAKLVAGTIAKDRLKLASATFAIASLPANSGVNVNTLLLSSAAFPIMLVLEKTTDPGSLELVMNLWLNTSSSAYFLQITNLSGFPSATVTVRVQYLQLT